MQAFVTVLLVCGVVVLIVHGYTQRWFAAYRAADEHLSEAIALHDKLE